MGPGPVIGLVYFLVEVTWYLPSRPGPLWRLELPPVTKQSVYCRLLYLCLQYDCQDQRSNGSVSNNHGVEDMSRVHWSLQLHSSMQWPFVYIAKKCASFWPFFKRKWNFRSYVQLKHIDLDLESVCCDSRFCSRRNICYNYVQGKVGQS